MVRISIAEDEKGKLTLYLSDKGLKEGAKEIIESAKPSDIFSDIVEVVKEVYEFNGDINDIRIKVIPHEEFEEMFGAE
ncbi:MAG: hypothetical protein QXL94_01625 [Candidatus Parvarchaeum sp.]